MPHADKSTRTPEGVPACPYCGWPVDRVRDDRGRFLVGHVTTCFACSDLPALEPLDDRYMVKPCN